MNKNISNPSLHRVILFILVFIYYGNTINNEFALDDTLVISNNKFVKKGISGIPDILMHDSYYGASGKIAKASGGRYRPLSVVSFAIEKEMFGSKASTFHFFNILFYGILCIIIYNFLLKHVFKENNLLAFCSTLLFLIHPIHTEVVANIKSRDEIYSLLFQIATLHYFLNYLINHKRSQLVLSIVFYALALLSKENGVTFILMIPLTIYVFTNYKINKIIKVSLPIWIILASYVFLRFSINNAGLVDEKDVLNSPYILASVSDKFATIALVLGKYLQLMFFPYPLSYDYSYNHIPYTSFSNPMVILSLIIYTLLLITGVIMTLKKKISGLFILFFLTGLFIVSNILINIGTPLAERFLFTPGLFFLVALVMIIKEYSYKFNFIKSQHVTLFMVIISLLTYFQVVGRNSDWKNNETLYFIDIKTASNSVRANAFCGITLVPLSDKYPDPVSKNKTLYEALDYFNKAYSIYPEFATMFQDWGGAYYKLNMIDSAEWAWNQLKVLKLDSKFTPYNEELISKYYYDKYNNLSNEALKRKDYAEMLVHYRIAIRYYNKMPDQWIYLGDLYRVNNKMDSAIICWNKAIEIDPENQKARELLNKYFP